MDDDIQLLASALNVLRTWYWAEKSMPGYSYGHGMNYLQPLLGIPYDTVGSQRDFMAAYRASGSTLLEAIVGPHGWAVLQMAIARQKAKEEGYLQRAQARRALHRFKKENEV